MKITFKDNVNVSETMVFEDIFEDELQLDEEEKEEIISKSFSTWMFVDGELAGESYGIKLKDLKENIEDCAGESRESVYCYSTALLPEFRRKGLGPILKAYWLGMLKANGIQRVVAHATSEQAEKLNVMFGAHFGPTHKNWYGTQRTATFYWIDL